MNERRAKRGQGLVEFAIMLPILLLLLIGLAELGLALRNYLVVVNADREGCRFAARGRYADEHVIERVISAGGFVRIEEDDVAYLRTHGTEPNTGVIVTHIVLDTEGDVISHTMTISGVVLAEGGTSMREIQPSGTVISLTHVLENQGTATDDINATRVAAGYEEMNNHIVVVEVFFVHHPLWGNMLNHLSFGAVPGDPWPMYAMTEMRVVTDRGGRTRRSSGMR